MAGAHWTLALMTSVTDTFECYFKIGFLLNQAVALSWSFSAIIIIIIIISFLRQKTAQHIQQKHNSTQVNKAIYKSSHNLIIKQRPIVHKTTLMQQDVVSRTVPIPTVTSKRIKWWTDYGVKCLWRALDLVRTTDKVEVVLVQKLRDNLSAKRERDTAVVLTPTHRLFVRVGPEQVTQEALVRNVCRTHDATDLLHRLQIGTQPWNQHIPITQCFQTPTYPNSWLNQTVLLSDLFVTHPLTN